MKVTSSIILVIILFLSCGANNDLEIATIEPTTSNDNQDSGLQSISDTHGDPVTAKINVLFVGNSLTYYNDLPKLIYEIAKSKDIEMSTKMIAKPNYAIIDHLDFGNEAENEIKSKKYDYVVIQQGPSSQSEGRDFLLEGGRRFNELCEDNDAKLVFFMVWPSRTYYETFDGVIKNYTEAAQKYKAILCPVGKEWKAHFDATNDFSYYGPDLFHPSQKGSQEAARIIQSYLRQIKR